MGATVPRHRRRNQQRKEIEILVEAIPANTNNFGMVLSLPYFSLPAGAWAPGAAPAEGRLT